MKKHMTRILASSLALAMALAMTACGGQDDTQKTDGNQETVGGETVASYKTELNVAINANPPSLDAHAANSNIVGGIGSHIYEPLFAMNANNEPTPVLAEGLYHQIA